MNIRTLETPAVLIRSKAMKENLVKYQQACDAYKKQLWPMIKTHKSTTLANMQKEIGASGFLCGTLDECEALCCLGISKIMYAYPVAGKISCMRAAKLAQKCEFYVRLDSFESARQLSEAAAEVGVTVNYTIILDCGLHRFGMAAHEVTAFADNLQQFKNLIFSGISTHCGHVYSEVDADKVALYAKEEREVIHTAVDSLVAAGYDVKLVTSGATPTFMYTVEDEYINVYHPGNYVFNDCIQIANKTVTEDECALVVYATVISHPSDNLFICDAGAKCLGLDQGAHGNSAVKGHGNVIGHPELIVSSLSEEVAKIYVEGETDLKIGDRIMIIPNHSCSTANLTGYYITIDEQMNVEQIISVDIRGNSTKKRVICLPRQGDNEYCAVK